MDSAALMLMLMTVPALAQFAPGSFDDHQNMMDQLGVKHLRRGPDPKDQSTFDEATANPYTNSMPDVLTMKDGTKVTRPEQWPARRGGNSGRLRTGSLRPHSGNVPKVNWEVVATTRGTNGGIPTVTKTLVGHVDNSSYTNLTVNIQASFTVPAMATSQFPSWLNSVGGFGARRDGREPSWHEQAITNGWGYGNIVPSSIQPDNNRLTSGIIGLTNKGQPQEAGRLGRVARLAMGREPADRLFRGPSGRRWWTRRRSASKGFPVTARRRS